MKTQLFLPIIILLTFILGCNFFKKKEETPLKPEPASSSSPAATPAVSDKDAKQTNEKNLLSLANGAFLLKYPLPNTWQFSPVALFDDGDWFWISQENKAADQVFIIGLPAETTFRNFSFTAGNDYYGEGSSAKDILIEVSDSDANSGYQSVLETSLPPDIKADKMFAVSREIPARFVKLTVKNSQSNPNYVSLGDFRGFGTQKAETSLLTRLTGTYHPLTQDETTQEYKLLPETESKTAKSYADVYLRQNGTQILGCEEQGESDYFNGGVEGNSAQVLWQYSPDEKAKPAMMSFTPDGKRMFLTKFNEDSGIADYTAFQKISDKPGSCSNLKGFDGNDGGKNQLAEKLEKDGRAVIYGINFDFNSDKLREETKSVLNQIAAVLREKSDWKMLIEGHTDNIGGESFNQTLSEKRAKAVVDYLTTSGIETSRLKPQGFGLSKPLAPNENEFGRAKNRRVELVKE